MSISYFENITPGLQTNHGSSNLLGMSTNNLFFVAVTAK